MKKDLLKNSCITGGHAEIEDETVLYIFGNSCEAVLGDSRYYDSVEKIKFEYILFEYIIEPNIMSLLRKFKYSAFNLGSCGLWSSKGTTSPPFFKLQS